ncbi:hypothetical protein J6590_029373 [Homalodisca vitripennis]|nr:hypothetical protein J6590_029373 [Homalodisca vitripennis]
MKFETTADQWPSTRPLRTRQLTIDDTTGDETTTDEILSDEVAADFIKVLVHYLGFALPTSIRANADALADRIQLPTAV